VSERVRSDGVRYTGTVWDLCVVKGEPLRRHVKKIPPPFGKYATVGEQKNKDHACSSFKIALGLMLSSRRNLFSSFG
jgi:hypothetical protein